MVTRVPAVFVFLVVGGVDNSGGLVAIVEMIMRTLLMITLLNSSGKAINLIDVLSASLANLTSALSVAPMPAGYNIILWPKHNHHKTIT